MRTRSDFKGSNDDPKTISEFNECLYIRKINEFKGRGVFTKRRIEKGTKITRYIGNLQEGKIPDAIDDSYVFEFFYKNKRMWIDATAEDNSFGRILNDDFRNPNSKVKIEEENQIPTLYFYALRDIQVDEEITYNYGSGPYPWRRKPKKTENRYFAIKLGQPNISASPYKLHGLDDAENSDLSCLETTSAIEHVPLDTSLDVTETIEHGRFDSSLDVTATAPLDYLRQSISDKRDIEKKSENRHFAIKLGQPNNLASPDKLHGLDDAENSDLLCLDITSDIEHGSFDTSLDVTATIEHGRFDSSLDVTVTAPLQSLMQSISDKRDVEKKSENRHIAIKLGQPNDPVSPDKLQGLDDAENSDLSCLETISAIEHGPLDTSLDVTATIEHGRFDSSLDVTATAPLDYQMQSISDKRDMEIKKLQQEIFSLHESLNKKILENKRLQLKFKVATKVNDCKQRAHTQKTRLPEEDDYIQDTSDSESSVSSDVCTEPSYGDTSCNITVRLSHSTLEKRVWDKYQYCIYCSNLERRPNCFINLSKHILRCHKDESEVLQIIAIPVGMPERKMLLEKLRNLGNYDHNMKVISEGSGEIIPHKCPSKFVPYTNYVPCKHCKGFFAKRLLWKHMHNCLFNHNTSEGNKNCAKDAELFLPPPKETKSALLDNVFCKMQQDQITLIVKHDALIIRYGIKLFQRLCSEDQCHVQISQKLRELGRFLKAMRGLDKKVNALTHCLTPKMFQVVIKVVRDIAGYNSADATYKTPSLALKIGHALNKCAIIKQAMAIEDMRKDLEHDAAQFLKLMQSDWTDDVSRNALKTLQQSKWNNPPVLPLAEDIIKLQQYLFLEMNEKEKQLSIEPKNETWKYLCKLVLTSVILFNRKRTGEASKILLTTYQFKKSTTTSPDIVDTLTPIEKEICKTYTRVEIKGKRGRKVPVIFTPYISSLLDLLVKTRDTVGINKNNKYLFPYHFDKALTHLRGHDCLREFASKCGAKIPQAITGTNLRKHIATFSQILNLKDHELDQLASYMGHDIRVHREYYRLPEDIYQLAKVGKLLLALDQGKFLEYKGKSLEEIVLDTGPLEDDDIGLKLKETINISPSRSEIIFTKPLKRKISSESLQKRKRKPSEDFGEPNLSSKDEMPHQQCDEPNLSSKDEMPQQQCNSEITFIKNGTRDHTSPFKRRRKEVNRHCWTEKEKSCVMKAFSSMYKLGRLPGKADIVRFQKNNLNFSSIQWDKIKQLARRQLNECMK